MTDLELGIALFAVMMILIVLRMPIAISMFVCGAAGFGMIAGWKALIGLMAAAPFSRVANHELTVIPLFILMGQFASQSGLSQSLYRSARAWFGHYRGGIAVATIGGCAAFGAICGSSVATGATMTSIALPEMRRYGYSGALASVEGLPEEGKSPAILLVHGDMDEVIPVDAMTIAREQLAQAGLPVEWHVARGLGHGIDPTGLKLGGDFLRSAFMHCKAFLAS